MFVFVFSLLYCSAFITLSVSCFTEPFLVSDSYFSLSLVFSCFLVVWFLTFCLVYWINPLPSIWTLFAPAWTIACVPGLLLLSSPLDIVHRSKTTPVYWSTHLSCPQYTCLPFVLTMSINKSLHMVSFAQLQKQYLISTCSVIQILSIHKKQYVKIIWY